MKLHVMAWRNILRNKRRTALSVAAISIAAMTVVLMFSLLLGMKIEIRNNLQQFYFGEIRIQNAEYEDYETLNPLHLAVTNVSQVSQELAATGLYASVSPRISLPVSIYQNGENEGLMVTGMDIENDAMNILQYITAGKTADFATDDIVLGTKAAADLGVAIGDRITALTMTMRRGSNGMSFTVAAIANLPLSEMNAMAMIPLASAQRFAMMGDRSTTVLLDVADGVSMKDAKAAATTVMAATGNEGAAVEAWDEIPSSYLLINLAQMVYYIAGSVFYVLASTVIINTIMMIIFERTREIGTLASMGMEGKEIVKMFFLESLFISTLGSIAGGTLGSIFTLILERTGIDFTEAMQGVDFEISGIMYPKLSVLNIVIAVASGIIVASGISLIPSRRAASIKPVEAMKSI